MDYYAVLGIADDASADAIRRAFRALALRFHPDVGVGSSTAQFQRAREAYETLIDPDRRRRYDRQLRASRARPLTVEELNVSTPLAEPLFDPRRTSRGGPGRWSAILPLSLYEEVVQEFCASLDDAWVRHQWFGRRWW